LLSKTFVLVGDIKAIDTTRPIVIGSDKYRSVPNTGSGADLILGQLDGLGLNYNTAASVDALHAKYPNTFLFESESSSETSTRGVYQDPTSSTPARTTRRASARRRPTTTTSPPGR
jgi:beta-galactosidase